VGNTPKRTRRSGATGTGPSGLGSGLGRKIGIGVVAVVLLAIVVTIALPGQTPAVGIPDGTETVAVASRAHVEGEIAYDDVVPAGGSHNPVWLNCGVYDAAVPKENAVHSLEHGAVWITYQPGIDAGQLDTLRGIAGDFRKVIVSPVAEQDSPVMATAWGYRLKLTDAGDSRLHQFVNEFDGDRHAPEPGAACSGGVGEPTG